MPFDPELYLRLAGERMLADWAGSRSGSWATAVAEAARALVAVGAIDAGAASSVFDDYALAMALRGNHGARRHQMRHGLATQRAPALRPRRVVGCDQVIELSSGTLRIRFVSLEADSTRIGVVFWPPARQPSRRSGRFGGHSGPGSSSPPNVMLTDDRGATARAHLARGGGSDDEWRGEYEAGTPLAAEASWIEIDGVRVDLSRPPTPVKVMVRSLPEQDPALRYLWRKLAAGDRHHDRSGLDTPIAALVAAGALDADNPALKVMRAVRDAVQGQATPARLPEPWRSLLARRGRGDGPSEEFVIGAVTPEFDGISIAVLTLVSHEDGFEIDVEMANGTMGIAPFDPDIEDTSVVWWAADDRSNQYLGEVGSWGGGNGRSSGTIGFWPSLDPRAGRLDLMPEGKTARAVISVPLALGPHLG